MTVKELLTLKREKLPFSLQLSIVFNLKVGPGPSGGIKYSFNMKYNSHKHVFEIELNICFLWITFINVKVENSDSFF